MALLREKVPKESTMARRPRVHRGRSPGKTSWVSLQVTNISLDTNATALILAQSADLDIKRPFTILRTHLFLSVGSDQSAADEVQFGAVGMCVVADQASAIGITAVPTPITDLGSDLFFLHQFFASDFALATAIGIAGTRKIFEISSKAMRKVNDDQEAILVGEVASISNGVNIQLGGRMLIKEN